jgi:hypothetical protein
MINSEIIPICYNQYISILMCEKHMWKIDFRFPQCFPKSENGIFAEEMERNISPQIVIDSGFMFALKGSCGTV